MAEEQLSEDEKNEIRELIGVSGANPSGNHNAHSFLHNVAVAEDTTRLGNLDNVEIGNMDNPIRSFKFLALFSDRIMKKNGLKEFFEQRSEIGTSTSLSKGGFLTKLAVVQRKELADVSPAKKAVSENKGWFKRKNPSEEGEKEA